MGFLLKERSSLYGLLMQAKVTFNSIKGCTERSSGFYSSL